MFRTKAKQGEIAIPLITSVLAKRIATRRETERLFPGCAPPLDFTDRELQVIEHTLKLATTMLQQRGRP